MRFALFDIQDQQRKTLTDALSEAGHESHFFIGNEQGLQEFGQQTFDMLVLNWENSNSVKRAYLHQLRSQNGPTLPIMLLVDAGTEESIVSG